jgi:hypothetical protein
MQKYYQPLEKKGHTNSEYINFQSMSFYWHNHWLTAITSLARDEYLPPSCHWTHNMGMMLISYISNLLYLHLHHTRTTFIMQPIPKYQYYTYVPFFIKFQNSPNTTSLQLWIRITYLSRQFVHLLLLLQSHSHYVPLNYYSSESESRLWYLLSSQKPSDFPQALQVNAWRVSH